MNEPEHYKVDYSAEEIKAYTNFCHVLDNTKPGYEYERLYVFEKECEFEVLQGEAVFVNIYIKFNLVSRRQGDFLAVISFHEANRPLRRLFE